jgi:hypothetical protein
MGGSGYAAVLLFVAILIFLIFAGLYFDRLFPKNTSASATSSVSATTSSSTVQQPFPLQ